MSRSSNRLGAIPWLMIVVCVLSGCHTAPLTIGFESGPSVGAAARRALTPFRVDVIDAHRQIYDMSCIPSSVEMVLKLLGRVPAEYYDLQEAWKNKTDGNFKDFENRTIAGVTFHQRFSLPRSPKFPLSQLFAAIRRELQEGRFVIVGLTSGDDGWHNWVIYDESIDGEFIAVTKVQKDTLELRQVKKLITIMGGTDIGVYESQGMEKTPNKSPEPTSCTVTPPAGAGGAPAQAVAHL